MRLKIVQKPAVRTNYVFSLRELLIPVLVNFPSKIYFLNGTLHVFLPITTLPNLY